MALKPRSPIGRMIRNARVQKDLTQRELAEELGMRTHVFLGEVERGNAQLPRKRWAQIADALDLDTKDIEAAALASHLPRIETKSKPVQDLAMVFARILATDDEEAATELLSQWTGA